MKLKINKISKSLIFLTFCGCFITNIKKHKINPNIFKNACISKIPTKSVSDFDEKEKQEWAEKKQKELEDLKLIDDNGNVKNFSEEEAKDKIKQLEKNNATQEMYVLNLIRKNKNKDDNALVEEYFKTNLAILGKLFSNKRIYRIKFKINTPTKNETETKQLNSILSKIKAREESFVENRITLPETDNVTFINPGHGFEDPGAIYEDKLENKIYEEKYLNAKTAYYTTLSALKQGFDVYLAFDLKEFGFDLPKDNPRLHIIFPSRPPISGLGSDGMVSSASSFCIKSVMKKIAKQKPSAASVVSVCLHHNVDEKNEERHGFEVYFRNRHYVKNKETGETDGKNLTTEFEENSKNLAKILMKNCKDVYKVKNYNISNDTSCIKAKGYLVCGGFGEEFKEGSSLLVECGYMSNKEQLKLINDVNKMLELTEQLIKSVCEFKGIEYKKIG